MSEKIFYYHSVLSFFFDAKADLTISGEDNIFKIQNRGEIPPRLSRWNKTIKGFGYPDEKSQLITSVIGEIVNNCFDHNLGQWKDLTGCMLSLELMQDRLRIAIADRGQGICNSLRSVVGDLPDQEIMNIAFEKKISGRAPEKRGNGLKYVIHSLKQNNGHSLLAISGNVFYSFGENKKLIDELINYKYQTGTLIILDWNKD